MKKLLLAPTIIGTLLLLTTLTLTTPAQAVRNTIQNPLIICQQKTSLLKLNNALKTKNNTDITNIYNKKECLIFPAKHGLEYTVTHMPDKNGIVTIDIFLQGKQDRAFTYENWLKDSSIPTSNN